MNNQDKLNQESIKKTLNINSDGTTKKKSGLKKYIIITSIIAVVAVGVYYFGFKAQKSMEFVSTNIKNQDLVITVSATGNLEPTNSVDVGIEVSGTMKEVYVDYNDRVKKDEVLAKLDTTKIEANVTNYKAALSVAKANLYDSQVVQEYTKTQYESYQQMWKENNKTYPSKQVYDKAKQDYDRAVATYKASSAKVEQAEAQLNSYKDDLKKAIVKAPFDGIILDKKIEVGQSVVAAMTIPILFTIAEDLKKMEVVVSVDEADIGKVKEGQKVRFSVDSYPSKSFDGYIKKVRLNSEVVSGVVTYETVVEVDNSELLLKPGMTANAEIIAKTIKDVPVIPNAALRYYPDKMTQMIYKLDVDNEDDKTYIWTLENNIPKKVEIEVGESDGEMTQVLNHTLTPESKIITKLKK